MYTYIFLVWGATVDKRHAVSSI